MKKAILIIVAILLCVSAFGCVESQRVQDTFQGSAEGKMIGKTFQDIEAEFGPFSMVYLDAEWTPMYLFTKTNVGFYFNDVGTPDSWAAMLKNGTTFIPAAVALQTVRGKDVCTGVSGRICDFGIPADDVSALSQYLNVFQINSYDTDLNTVYTVTTADQALDVYVFVKKGSKSILSEDQVRVMQAGVMTVASAAPQTSGSRKYPKYKGADVTVADMVAVGNTVTFGVYEQDNDLKNGPEPLQWKVLKKTGKRVLLFSEKIIDARAFHDTYGPTRWRVSNMRTWLNGDFMQTAFTEAEQKLIPQVELPDSGNDYYGVDPGVETVDRVFLLSADEMNAYFRTDPSRKAQPTEYAKARGFSRNPDGWWWLRNPGEDASHASLVYKSGNIYLLGERVTRDYIGVRPALWVELP